MFLWIAHAALLMNVSMSAGSSELAMSVSDVCIIIWWMYLLMAIALRIFNLGWLTVLCYAIALHVRQFMFEHCPGVVHNNSGAWVFLQPDFSQLINVCW
jgi:hypothetical protein